jgi:hypothetical protein
MEVKKWVVDYLVALVVVSPTELNINRAGICLCERWGWSEELNSLSSFTHAPSIQILSLIS